MKKFISFFLAVLLCAALIVPTSAASAPAAFKDVPAGIWYASAVKYVVSHGLFEGVGGGKFAPNATMDRAMFATVLSRVAKADTAAEPKADLNDVPAKRYFSGPVNWAVNHGYMMTASSGSFAPNAPMTRQETADAMYRYLTDIGVQAEDSDAVDLPFTDMDKAADWAVEGIKFVWEKGLMEGNGDGTFDPDGQLTRAQAATVFRRLDKWLAKLDTQPEDPDTTEEPGDELPFPDCPYLVDDAYIAEFTAEVLRLCNEARAAEGVAPLKYMDDMQRVIDARAAELPISYSHTRPGGGDCRSIFDENGYRLHGPGGENIVSGGRTNAARSDTASEVMVYANRSAIVAAEKFFNAWMNSEGHRSNIMNPGFCYTAIGLSYETEQEGHLYAAQIFTGNYSPVP